ncbi:MAG: hypothetical protein AUK47_01830 [Deltaproteobacteria bacterium CG2_30_63_29]|nr:MAG: hypothetical protein AUK47_01830 [Deltaproteobacteria bacterium CG2_30_63_29]PJB39947.1 MAG: hypothetical protein CO108_16000 [Deltaproteobacteria bacterium CG_4_9_14_3_um_filter_63_12]
MVGLSETEVEMRMNAMLLAVFLLLVSPTAVFAAEAPFAYGVTEQLPSGEPVTLSVVAAVDLKSMSLEVKREKDGASWTFKTKKLAAGETKDFEWKQPSGTFQYSMKVVAIPVDGDTYDDTLTFAVSSFDELKVELDTKRSSLSEGELFLEAERPIAFVEMEVYGEGRRLLASDRFDGGKREVGIGWKDLGSAAVYVRLQVYENEANTTLLELFSLEIPHEDVVFESNDATLRADQEVKLEATLEAIEEARRTYDEVSMELFVAGYTDTVGSGADNVELSERRAKAIAVWFQGRLSVALPISYQGFGEDALSVQTSDGVDEEKNRRAVYLLSNSAPGETTDFPRSKWKRLR